MQIHARRRPGEDAVLDGHMEARVPAIADRPALALFLSGMEELGVPVPGLLAGHNAEFVTEQMQNALMNAHAHRWCRRSPADGPR